jgi:hypothetical protein
MLPAAVGQDEVVEPVGQGPAGDGDGEVRGVGEVGQRHAAGLGRLAEDDVPLRAVQGAPVAHPPLQGPPDVVVGEGVRVGHLQVAQQGDGLHRRVVLEDRPQQRLPDRGERVGDGAAALGPALGGQAGIGLDPAGGALTEAGPGGGGALAMTTSVSHVGSHLLVGGGFARHVGTSVWRQRSPSYRPAAASTPRHHPGSRRSRRWPQPPGGLRPPYAWSHRPTWLSAPVTMIVAKHERLLLGSGVTAARHPTRAATRAARRALPRRRALCTNSKKAR